MLVAVGQSTTLLQTEISQQLLDCHGKCGTDIHGAQRTNLDDFGDRMTFPLLPPLG